MHSQGGLKGMVERTTQSSGHAVRLGRGARRTPSRTSPTRRTARWSSAPSTSTSPSTPTRSRPRPARQRDRRHRALPQARPQPAADRDVPGDRPGRRGGAHPLHRLGRRAALSTCRHDPTQFTARARGTLRPDSMWWRDPVPPSRRTLLTGGAGASPAGRAARPSRPGARRAPAAASTWPSADARRRMAVSWSTPSVRSRRSSSDWTGPTVCAWSDSRSSKDVASVYHHVDLRDLRPRATRDSTGSTRTGGRTRSTGDASGPLGPTAVRRGLAIGVIGATAAQAH